MKRLKSGRAGSEKYHRCPSERPSDCQFNKTIVLHFEDGSKVEFRYAFLKERKNQLDVFTEHCGYHSFFKESVVLIEELGNHPEKRQGKIKVRLKYKGRGKPSHAEDPWG